MFLDTHTLGYKNNSEKATLGLHFPHSHPSCRLSAVSFLLLLHLKQNREGCIIDKLNFNFIFESRLLL